MARSNGVTITVKQHGGNSGPGRACSKIIADVSDDTYVNIMAQYRPAYQANRYPEMARRITSAEYRRVEWARGRRGSLCSTAATRRRLIEATPRGFCYNRIYRLTS